MTLIDYMKEEEMDQEIQTEFYKGRVIIVEERDSILNFKMKPSVICHI